MLALPVLVARLIWNLNWWSWLISYVGATGAEITASPYVESSSGFDGSGWSGVLTVS